MDDKLLTLNDNQIKNKIYTIRGLQVMFDSDLALFYNVSTKVLNQAVKRNINRFPDNFMFRLKDSEHLFLRSHFVTLERGRGKHKKYLPLVFTEQGVAMLAGILRSKIAIIISIQIINAFVNMRKLISSNELITNRLDCIELKQIEYSKKFNQIFKAIENKNLKPKKGIFYDGQIFDAYIFVSSLIRKASKSIILIDNYVDDSVLTLFTKRKKNVKVTIYTKNIPNQLKLDLEKYNLQYYKIELKQFKNSHDRFMVIDSKEIYHFGASLKDLGKKWFAFSRFEKEATEMLNRLSKLE